VLDIPANSINGGRRSDPFFYKNPQFLIRFDLSKYVGDKQKLLSMQIEAEVHYQSASGNENKVHLYLCKSADQDISKGHRGLVFSVDEKNIANPKEIHDHMYSMNASASSAVI
jgi:hypothetical protein